MEDAAEALRRVIAKDRKAWGLLVSTTTLRAASERLDAYAAAGDTHALMTAIKIRRFLEGERDGMLVLVNTAFLKEVADTIEAGARPDVDADRAVIYVRREAVDDEDIDLLMAGAFLVKVDADLEPSKRAVTAISLVSASLSRYVEEADDAVFTAYDAEGNELEPSGPVPDFRNRGVLCGDLARSDIPATPVAAMSPRS